MNINPSNALSNKCGLRRSEISWLVGKFECSSRFLLRVVALSSIAFVLNACPKHKITNPSKEADNQWEKIIKAEHWTPEIPPSTYTRPGLVFAVLKDSAGNQYRRTLCQDITDGMPLKVDSMVPVSLSSKIDFGASAGVSVSEKILNTSGSAKLNASISNIKSVTFVPKDAKRFEMASPPKNGERTIPTACLPDLESSFYRNANGTFKYPVYIVVQALSYGALTAKYEGQSGPQFTARLVAASIANAQADVHAKKIGTATLEFTPKNGKVFYIGTHLLQVTRLNVLREIAANPVANIYFKKPKSSDISNLGNLPIR